MDVDSTDDLGGGDTMRWKVTYVTGGSTTVDTKEEAERISNLSPGKCFVHPVDTEKDERQAIEKERVDKANRWRGFRLW